MDPSTGQAIESSMSLDSARNNAFPSKEQSRHQEVAYPAVLDAYVTSPKDFHENYEAHCIPCVIRNIPYGATAVDVTDLESSSNTLNELHFQEEEKKDDTHHHQQPQQKRPQQQPQMKEWPAIQRWSLTALANDYTLRDRALKCGEDDDGYTIRIKLKYFLRYLHENKDDSPLYIFDATFDEDKYAKQLLQDYTVPRYFDEDLLGLVGERRRPPYRWFLVGPCRSGTTVHIDPLGTSAWNTLIHGVKRWVLFPPHVPKSVVKGRKLILPGEDDEAIHYFTTILPRMKRRAAACKGTGEYANFECYEFTQYAGETVFVPHGWWHAVMNVTHTVGITQNYCSSRNFEVVWMQTRSGRKKMACSWLRRLNEKYPHLAKKAKEYNWRDGFVMWEDDEVEQKKWRKKRADKLRKRREKAKAKQLKKEKAERRKHTASANKEDSDSSTESRDMNSGSGYISSGQDSKRSRTGSLSLREVSPE